MKKLKYFQLAQRMVVGTLPSFLHPPPHTQTNIPQKRLGEWDKKSTWQLGSQNSIPCQGKPKHFKNWYSQDSWTVCCLLRMIQ